MNHTFFSATVFFALLVGSVLSVLECSSQQIQAVLGQYSSICSSLFSDTLTLSSELNDNLYLLNHTATLLSTLVPKVLYCS